MIQAEDIFFFKKRHLQHHKFISEHMRAKKKVTSTRPLMIHLGESHTDIKEDCLPASAALAQRRKTRGRCNNVSIVRVHNSKLDIKQLHECL